MIKIGKDIKVQAQEFKGKTYIAIRRWYEEDGVEKPGKQGINLKVEEWQEFLDKLEDIKGDIKL
ncbi:MAG: transcriptional coactivator p15/PC4 family protein [Spirochaetia bacterium]|nr:transcriptional coactivator p15/PC4 family protein [Spirochaetia bacterium]